MLSKKQKKNYFSVNILIKNAMLKRRRLAGSAISNSSKDRQFITVVK